MKFMHKGAYIRECTDEMAEKLAKEGFVPLEIEKPQEAPQDPPAGNSANTEQPEEPAEEPKAEKKAGKKGE